MLTSATYSWKIRARRFTMLQTCRDTADGSGMFMDDWTNLKNDQEVIRTFKNCLQARGVSTIHKPEYNGLTNTAF